MFGVGDKVEITNITSMEGFAVTIIERPGPHSRPSMTMCWFHIEAPNPMGISAGEYAYKVSDMRLVEEAQPVIMLEYGDDGW